MRILLVLLALLSPALADFDALLRRVVKSDGVDYTTLKKERAVLDRYVESLEKASPGSTREEKIAFWINAYNALTLQQVLDTKPDKGDFSVNDDVKDFWKRRMWTVAGRKLHLDAIENVVLRKEFDEPRIHFALNCASRSCPPLMAGLYRGKTLDAVLTKQTRAFLGDREQNTFDAGRKRAQVSMLFKWYGGDFQPDVPQFLAKYAPAEAAASLRKDKWTIAYRSYDWGLNESGRRHASKGGSVGIVWIVLYLLATGALLLYGLHAFKLIWWRARWGKRYREQIDEARASPSTHFPTVLVQLPVYNEPGVVERAIAAAAALDWPALEIQVLDDSTDESCALIDRAVAGCDRDIRVIRRAHRDGFKAGALAAGLAQSDAAFVAIFDADFVPAPDFLRRSMPLFGMHGRVACVQGRWEHLNREQNWLTRAQAVAVDAHFLVHQLARAARGAFLNFAGTAGIWRREAIEDAGGWRGDTLTEDLDLSYRAQLRGWRIVFDPELPVPAELPPTVGAYKTQQRRWACGTTQCARKHLGAVWRARLPLAVKTEATAHLSGYAACVAMLALILLLPLGAGHAPILAKNAHLWPLWLGIWVAALGPFTCSILGQRFRPGTWRSILGCFLLILGACANNALAVLRGLFWPIRTFVRTPKQGKQGRPVRAPAPVLEQVMMLVTIASAIVLAQTHPWAVATYALFCSAGFVGLALYWWLAERRA